MSVRAVGNIELKGGDSGHVAREGPGCMESMYHVGLRDER